jgi:hypothetical protein
MARIDDFGPNANSCSIAAVADLSTADGDDRADRHGATDYR